MKVHNFTIICTCKCHNLFIFKMVLQSVHVSTMIKPLDTYAKKRSTFQAYMSICFHMYASKNNTNLQRHKR